MFAGGRRFVVFWLAYVLVPFVIRMSHRLVAGVVLGRELVGGVVCGVGRWCVCWFLARGESQRGEVSVWVGVPKWCLKLKAQWVLGAERAEAGAGQRHGRRQGRS